MTGIFGQILRRDIPGKTTLSVVGVSSLRMRAVEGLTMGERRNSRRSKSFLRGFVYFSRKRGALACLIRDLSDKGARIIFSDTVTLPDVVELYIPQREQTFRARVQWRRTTRSVSPSPQSSARRRGSADGERSHPAARAARSRNRLAARALKRLKGEKADAERGGLSRPSPFSRSPGL